ncbi:Cyclin-dependent kinase C-1 [Pelomyxa schiedti]|nr:Cyclin-dependent kinase C-1 [Pelomyxa schiedti]
MNSDSPTLEPVLVTPTASPTYGNFESVSDSKPGTASDPVVSRIAPGVRSSANSNSTRSTSAGAGTNSTSPVQTHIAQPLSHTHQQIPSQSQSQPPPQPQPHSHQPSQAQPQTQPTMPPLQPLPGPPPQLHSDGRPRTPPPHFQPNAQFSARHSHCQPNPSSTNPLALASMNGVSVGTDGTSPPFSASSSMMNTLSAQQVRNFSTRRSHPPQHSNTLPTHPMSHQPGPHGHPLLPQPPAHCSTSVPSSKPPGGPNGLDCATDPTPLWGSRSVDVYTKIEQVGEGTYGQVYKASYPLPGGGEEFVALKKVRMDNEKEGFPITAIREIKILRELDHPNIIKLKEIVTSRATATNKGSIYMVFEYMDHDLKGLMDTPTISKWFTQPQIKCYMKQLLEGLNYCHANSVLHRDIKAANLLINNEGILKLADFGLARTFNDQQRYTNRVITLWYRPPELLLGDTRYGSAVDMWSVGCILAELLTNKPLFPGTSELEQLEFIFKICGSPDRNTWPEAEKLPFYDDMMPKMARQNYPRRLREAFKDVAPEAIDLVERMLTLNPAHRISAESALDADYFWADPRPAEPKSLPRYPQSHEWNLKKRRQQNQPPNPKRQKDGQGNPTAMAHQQTTPPAIQTLSNTLPPNSGPAVVPSTQPLLSHPPPPQHVIQDQRNNVAQHQPVLQPSVSLSRPYPLQAVNSLPQPPTMPQKRPVHNLVSQAQNQLVQIPAQALIWANVARVGSGIPPNMVPQVGPLQLQPGVVQQHQYTQHPRQIHPQQPVQNPMQTRVPNLQVQQHTFQQTTTPYKFDPPSSQPHSANAQERPPASRT